MNNNWKCLYCSNIKSTYITELNCQNTVTYQFFSMVLNNPNSLCVHLLLQQTSMHITSRCPSLTKNGCFSSEDNSLQAFAIFFTLSDQSAMQNMTTTCNSANNVSVITNTVNKTQLCTLLYLPGYCCLSSGCLRLQYSTAEMVAFSPRSSSHSHFSMFRRLDVLLPTSSSGATCCQAGCSPPIALSSSKIRTNYCQWKHVKCLAYLSWHHKIKENRVIPLYHVWH